MRRAALLGWLRGNGAVGQTEALAHTVTQPAAAIPSAPADRIVTSLPAVVVEQGEETFAVPAGEVELAMPRRDFVGDLLVPMLHLAPTYLPHQEIFDVVVRRESDRMILVEGVDYAVGADQGSIAGLVAIESYLVLVNYTADCLRYDTVAVDPRSGAVTLASASDRGNDAGEHLPVIPPGAVGLFTILVSRRHGCEVLPLHAWDGFVRAGGEGKHAAWVDRMRRALPRLTRLMRSGAPVTLAGYGDSITEVGYTAPNTPGTSSWYVPNGPTRDNLFYFTGPCRLPAATVGRIDLEDWGDGAGRVHTRTGWNYKLAATIEARSSSRVTYLNLGIGGTATGSGHNDQGCPNGTHPDRLAALARAGADVVSIAFGMNELGSPRTFAQLVDLIQAVQAMGADPIVWGVPLYANLTGYAAIASWRVTNTAIVQAARACGAAYVPLQRIADPERLGALGIAWRSASSCNGINHPGPYEFERYGAFGAMLIP